MVYTDLTGAPGCICAKTKEITYNYVDRVRLAESSLQDHKCPTRGSGWRHNKSISHLDLATSCHSAAYGLNHWSHTRQLRHSRSLDYNQIDHCSKDALDIAEFYWRIDPEADNYDETIEPHHYRDYNYGDENYHSTSSIYQHQLVRSAAAGGGGGSTCAAPPVLQAFDFGSDSCSLRRSRSLAVIREETFSDLQITSANSSRRRSQLIPRARLVNRGFFRERERLICGSTSNKHHHHHHSTSREKLANSADQEIHSNASGGVGICDSVQHQHHHHHHHHDSHQQSREADDYYDNLKRLDALAVDLAEQLHPWHNDKSDLESLNSDYFKNSLHQTHELKQQLDLEALEQAVSLLAQEKPRIYQSRRQQRIQTERVCTAQQKSQSTTGADSCPETSQSSVFPETTTSNSDDQTDSPSLSEQEYDLTRIEEIYQKTQLEGDEESYELISLTTTTRTRIETTEDEEEDIVRQQKQRDKETDDSTVNSTTDTEIEAESTLKRSRGLSENLEKLIAYDSVYLSSEEGSESTLIEENCAASVEEAELETSTLLHISIEDTIYEPQAKQHKTDSEVTRIGQQEEQTTEFESLDPVHTNGITEISAKRTNESETVLEPLLYTQILKVEHTPSTINSIPTAVVGVTSSVASKPKILSVVEKRKLKRYSDSTISSNGTCESSQRDILEHLSHNHNPSTENPFTHPKRQATDSLYIPFKETLGDNQYHSLPDVNIGQSLKVSECIDAKLRSSYNLNKYQRVDDELVDCRLREAKTTTTTLIVENRNSKGKQREEIVTSEEIYDSIKRFGRAHQKARQKEYQELNEVVEEEKKKEIKDKRSQLDSSETVTSEICLESATTFQTDAPLTTDECVSLSDVHIEHSSTDEQYSSSTTEAAVEHTDTDDYEEKLKEEPKEEVANFSKQIKRRAKEIRENAWQARHNQIQQLKSTTLTTATFRINKSAYNFPKTNTENTPTQVDANQFRIIVTDAHNNVIEEDSIDGSIGESLNTAAEEREEATKTDEKSATKSDQELTSEIKSTSVPEVAKEKHKDKSTTVNGHSRVASLKRVPSKPKRQQLHQHSCQQLNKTTSNATGNGSDKNCSDSSTKSKERRVLSTQIYKARPIKVLTSSDSFRRAVGNKMSRPQILHVVDNKRKPDIVGSSTTNNNNNNNNNNNSNSNTNNVIISNAKIEANQVENEYLKKVDAVRCYWSKLAKDEAQIQKQHEKHEQHEQHQQHELHEHQNQANNSSEAENCNAQPQPRQFVLGAPEPCAKMEAKLPRTPQHQDDFCSYMPSIEIVELDGERRATIVSAVPPNSSPCDTLSNDASEPQFDHIRYKVLKSQQLIRSNILSRNKKEAQFDGLIQYLQEYSFQELLSNNNVVIVEPVRTKIERPHALANAGLTKLAHGTPAPSPTTHHEGVINGSQLKSNAVAALTSKQGSGGIKRHFFYQPVRVNRELYEEELPNPDTVRNVRKFFEEHILPTSGQGLVVRGENNGSKDEQAKTALQQSPKSRRARKYRYLTIDTSYGHAAAAAAVAAQKQPLPSRKWDTASLSSGISSGDLSSPCDCNDADTVGAHGARDAKAHEATAEELKGVHVQDLVRRHNNSNITALHSTSVIGVECVKGSRARPNSAVYGPTGDASDNRDNFEYSSGQHCWGQPKATTSKCSKNMDTDNHLFPDDDGADDDKTDVEGEGDGVDDDDELYESYYVSNDILEKIRECGSSVTYYGGRVLQTSSPDPLCNGNQGQLNHNNANHSTMTLTRARAREIETCNVCQRNECPHTQQLLQQFQRASKLEGNQKTTEDTDDNKDASYLGIKFKLVKSNSCNSRLELAGAGGVVEEEETEVVRRMVHRFENQKTSVNKKEDTFTINSQTPACRAESSLAQSVVAQQVTVNNHINVPVGALETAKIKPCKNGPAKAAAHVAKDTDKSDTNVADTPKVFQSTTMDIRLDMTGSGGGKSGNGSGTTKICRNKNVDLAYTIAKQQQLQAKSTGINKDIVKPLMTQYLSKIDDTPSQSERTHKISKSTSVAAPAPATATAATIHTNTPIAAAENTRKTLIDSNLPLLSNDDARRITASSRKFPPAGPMPETERGTQQQTTGTGTVTAPMTPTQIIVPVEIHRTQEERPSLSTTSSGASLIDKTFVRHYVANDKSLFEKRKYDDIEFEEFEVYDPTKDFERLTESAEHADGHETEMNNSNMNSDNNRSCGSNSSIVNQHIQLEQLNDGDNAKSRASSVGDLSSLKDEHHGMGAKCAKSVEKAESNGFEILDDKL